MKTAIQELIEYFTDEERKGTSHWCVHDLIAKLYESKQMEIQQMETMYNHAMLAIVDGNGHGQGFDEYYNKTYKQDEKA